MSTGTSPAKSVGQEHGDFTEVCKRFQRQQSLILPLVTRLPGLGQWELTTCAINRICNDDFRKIPTYVEPNCPRA